MRESRGIFAGLVLLRSPHFVALFVIFFSADFGILDSCAGDLVLRFWRWGLGYLAPHFAISIGYFYPLLLRARGVVLPF